MVRQEGVEEDEADWEIAPWPVKKFYFDNRNVLLMWTVIVSFVTTVVD